MSNSKSHKNSPPFFYAPKNINTKDKENLENAYNMKAQIYKNTGKTNKAELENTCKQTVVNPETSADETSGIIEPLKYSEAIENHKHIEGSKEIEMSDSVSKENSEGISAEATEVAGVAEIIEEPHNKAPESAEKANKWFNPISDLIKLYISNIKKTRRGL